MCIKINPDAAPWKARTVYKVMSRNYGSAGRTFRPMFGFTVPHTYRIGELATAEMQDRDGHRLPPERAGFHVFKTVAACRRLIKALGYPGLAIVACEVSPFDVLAVGVTSGVCDTFDRRPAANATYKHIRPLRVIE